MSSILGIWILLVSTFKVYLYFLTEGKGKAIAQNKEVRKGIVT